MKYLVVVGAVLVAAVIATFARYESFHPCDWLIHDTGRALGVPAFMAEARVRASFMFRGIAEPEAYDCLDDWWRLKAQGKIPDDES